MTISSTTSQPRTGTKVTMKVAWHFTMKEIAPESVEVMALVEVADKHKAEEHKAMVVKAKAWSRAWWL
jgi:hypothetical protein